MVDQALAALDADCEALHPHTGRSSIAPNYLLRAALLQILYSARSPSLLIKHIDYTLQFCRVIALAMDDAVWDHSTFTKTHDRLLEGDIVLCLRVRGSSPQGQAAVRRAVQSRR